MKGLADFVIKRRILIVALFVLAALISILFIPQVKINYDLTAYLPEEMNTKKAIRIMESEFTLLGQAELMLENVTIPEVLDLKSKLEVIRGVDSIIWLDDILDIRKPLEMYDKSVVEDYYKDGAALLQLVFVEDDYSLKTDSALEKIKQLIGEKGVLGGSAVNKKAMRENTVKEVVTISLLSLPIFIIILLLTTRSWFEPVLYLSVIGISVIINMGTNVIYKDISFITQSCAAILQLALSMDYSLFLLHRYSEEREKGLEAKEAMQTAVVYSFPSLAASCLTTLAGFAALMFMSYRIGYDMSLVLGKGVILSLVSVILLLPGVTIIFHKQIENSQHAFLLPSLKRFGEAVVRSRWAVVAAVCLLLIPAYLAQTSNTFLYSETSIAADENTTVGKQVKRIEDRFGINNQTVLLLPGESIAKELALSKHLQGKDYIKSVQALVTIADPSVPKAMLPAKIIERFSSTNYTRVILNLNVPIESDITYLAVQDIHDTVNSYYDQDYYLLGSCTSVSDIKEVVERDFTLVNLISIFAVALIILATFRSLLLPILLVLVIEAAIWINMAIPFFMDSPLIFIGFMIVSAIQLGATIDYAILLTNRYMTNREAMDSKTAAVNALVDSGWSVITSALILFVAGMGVFLISSIKGVSELGMLIGRGAALSGIMVLVILPQSLVLFDKLIQKTTLKGIITIAKQ